MSPPRQATAWGRPHRRLRPSRPSPQSPENRHRPGPPQAPPPLTCTPGELRYRKPPRPRKECWEPAARPSLQTTNPKRLRGGKEGSAPCGAGPLQGASARRRSEGQPMRSGLCGRAGGSSRRGGPEPVAEVRGKIKSTRSDTSGRSDDRGGLRAALGLTGPSCFFLHLISHVGSLYRVARTPGRGWGERGLGGARVGAVSEGKGRRRGGGARGGERHRDGGPGARAAAGRVATATGALAQLRVRRPGRHFGGCRGTPPVGSFGASASHCGSRNPSVWCDECWGQGLAHPLLCGGLRAREYRPEAKVCFPPLPSSSWLLPRCHRTQAARLPRWTWQEMSVLVTWRSSGFHVSIGPSSPASACCVIANKSALCFKDRVLLAPREDAGLDDWWVRSSITSLTLGGSPPKLAEEATVGSLFLSPWGSSCPWQPLLPVRA